MYIFSSCLKYFLKQGHTVKNKHTDTLSNTARTAGCTQHSNKCN